MGVIVNASAGNSGQSAETSQVTAVTAANASAVAIPERSSRPVHVQLVRAESLDRGDARVSGAQRKRQWRWPISYRSVEPLAIVADIAIIVLACMGAGGIYELLWDGSPGDPIPYLAVSVMVAALNVAILKERGLYKPTELLGWNRQARAVILAWTSVFLLLAGCAFALKVGSVFSRAAISTFAAIGLFGLLAHRVFWRILLRKGLASGKLSGRTVLLVSDGLQGPELLNNLRRHGFRVQRHITVPSGHPRQARWEEAISQAISHIRGSKVDELFVAADLHGFADLHASVDRLRLLPTPVNLVAVGPTAELLRRTSHNIGNETVLELQRAPLDLFESTIKRLIDLAFAAAAIIVLLPLLILVSVAIKLDSSGPVVFRQMRLGYNGRAFKILKFRTMTVQEDGAEVKQAARDDDRVTRVGAWLRRTSIDELPQLINVLKGDMSIVGPRPHAVSHDIHFDKNIINYASRHRMRPGLTGLAQVNGCRGETPTLNSMERRVDFDVEYIDNWSLRLDFAIMLRTLAEITRGRNAY